MSKRRRARRTRRAAILLLVAAMLLLLAWAVIRARPQDLPWTPLDLNAPPGLFTGRKLAALGDDAPKCQALLTAAHIRYEPLAARREGPHCGYTGAVRLLPAAPQIVLAPAGPPLSCPVAAGMALWDRTAVQPAARHYLGAPVAEIEHYGSYNCRPIAGSAFWSEHSTADALDIAAFRLADGRRISIAADWRGDGPEATFLHKVRNAACPLFATVLSPDYNTAHHDHLHLDQAARGAWGWRACR